MKKEINRFFSIIHSAFEYFFLLKIDKRLYFKNLIYLQYTPESDSIFNLFFLNIIFKKMNTTDSFIVKFFKKSLKFFDYERKIKIIKQ